MEKLLIKIERKAQNRIYWREYSLDFQAGKSVFWWLKHIQEEIDTTLAFECSCNAGLCGACALRVNDRAVLACKELVSNSDTLTIRPLAHLHVAKDLVIDWGRIERRLRSSNRWLFTDYEPMSNNYLLDVANTDLDKKLANCISCGICVSVCPVMKREGFEYPFIFCKAHRLILDPNVPQELRKAIQSNLEDKADNCIGCGACDRNCPKGVSPSISVCEFRQ